MAYLDLTRVHSWGPAWFHCRMQQFLRENASDSTIRAVWERYTGGRPELIERYPATTYDPACMKLTCFGKKWVYIGQTPTSRCGAKFWDDYYRALGIDRTFGVNKTIMEIGDSIRAKMGLDNPEYRIPVLWSGYSMGGGVASYLAYRFFIRDIVMRCPLITFGAIRIGNPTYGTPVAQLQGARYMNIGDPVPLIPPLPDEHSGWDPTPRPITVLEAGQIKHHFPGYVLDDNVSRFVQETGARLGEALAFSLITWLISSTSNPASEHSLARYEVRLSSFAAAELAAVGPEASGADSSGTSEGGDWGRTTPNVLPPVEGVPFRFGIAVPRDPTIPAGGAGRGGDGLGLGNLPGLQFGPARPAGWNRPFYAARMANAKRWGVYYAQAPVLEKLNRKRARHLARRLNDMLQFMQANPDIQPATVSFAFASELSEPV